MAINFDLLKKSPLDGSKICYLSTIGSWYANGFLDVCVQEPKGQHHYLRISVDTLKILLPYFEFKMVAKREYIHLEAPFLKKEVVEAIQSSLKEGK